MRRDLSRELDRAFALLDVATTGTSPLFAQAVRAYDTARTILPRISGLSDDERLQVESRLKKLRSQTRQGGTVFCVDRVVAPRATMFPVMVSQFVALNYDKFNAKSSSTV